MLFPIVFGDQSSNTGWHELLALSLANSRLEGDALLFVRGNFFGKRYLGMVYELHHKAQEDEQNFTLYKASTN